MPLRGAAGCTGAAVAMARVLFSVGRGSSAPSSCRSTRAAYSCVRRVYVRHGTKHVGAPRKSRTSENAVNAKFAELPFQRLSGNAGQSPFHGPVSLHKTGERAPFSALRATDKRAIQPVQLLSRQSLYEVGCI